MVRRVAVREAGGGVGDVVEMCCWVSSVQLKLTVPPTLASPARGQSALRVILQSVSPAVLALQPIHIVLNTRLKVLQAGKEEIKENELN